MTRIVFLREGGGEQMFRDVEFLPEMLKSDKAVYELLGVNFKDVAVNSTSIVQVTVLLWKGSRIPIPSAWKNAVKRGFPS